MSATGILIIGGGLAGITAALDCAEAGAQVTLMEVRPRLGGAAFSFTRNGLELDNGQHVFLRCCFAYRALLERLGSERRVRIQNRLEIPVLSPGCKTQILRRSNLPAPAHLGRALLRYRRLGLSQRLRAARTALCIDGLQLHESRLEEQTFGRWLTEHGSDEATIDALWELIALPTLNLRAREASAALCAFVFKTALLQNAAGGDIGFHERPLSEILGAPALDALRKAGVGVKLSCGAERIEQSTGAFEISTAKESISARAVILAIPHQRASTLLEGMIGERAQSFARLGRSPILNLHLIYDRQVCEHGFAAGIATPVQYLFDRSKAAGLTDGQYLAISISGADEDEHLSSQRLRERYLPAMERILPRARHAKLEDFIVTREHAATFRAKPGTTALRPGPKTTVKGLTLAGSWTATGWPATLEGAVLSGHSAAASALAEL